MTKEKKESKSEPPSPTNQASDRKKDPAFVEMDNEVENLASSFIKAFGDYCKKISDKCTLGARDTVALENYGIRKVFRSVIRRLRLPFSINLFMDRKPGQRVQDKKGK